MNGIHPTWPPLIKYLEFWIAFYQVGVGLYFIIDPAVLQADVYVRWQQMGANFWGGALVSMGVAHVSALWLNGRSSRLSRSVRFVTCLVHFYIALQFAVFFVQGGAPWGALTMLILLVPMIIPVLMSTSDQFKEVWDNR